MSADSPAPTPTGSSNVLTRGLDWLLARSLTVAGVSLVVFFLTAGVTVSAVNPVVPIALMVPLFLSASALLWLAGRWIAPDTMRGVLWRTRNALGSLLLGTVAASIVALAAAETLIPSERIDGPALAPLAFVAFSLPGPLGLILWIILLVQSIRAKASGFLRRVPDPYRVPAYVGYFIGWTVGFIALLNLAFISVILIVMFSGGIVDELTTIAF